MAQLFQYLLMKSSSERYIDYLRKLGMKIGDRTTVFSPRHTMIDETRPFLIEIGDDVQITQDVTILTHGYDWSVLKHCYGNVLGSSGKVKIGNNVFIGMKATILKGTTIGDNVIIGANSLVNRDVPDNCVFAGNPGKFIMTIEEYYKKRKDAQAKEAKELVVEYFNRFHRIPPKDALSEFFWLFENRGNKLTESFEAKMKLTGNLDVSKYKYSNSSPTFSGYKEFLKYCGIVK